MFNPNQCPFTMESNEEENYEEFREEEGPNGRKVVVRTTTKTSKTLKSITTASSSSATSSAAVSPTSPGAGPGRIYSPPPSPIVPLSAPSVCSQITTIVLRDGEELPSDGSDFAQLEALARQREEGFVQRKSTTTTTTTVHHRTITQVNQNQNQNQDVFTETSALHSPVSSGSDNSLGRQRLRPVTLQMHSSDNNDSLLGEEEEDAGESATFQNILKFQSTYESTPVSSPAMSSMPSHDRFTSGDSLYRSVHYQSSCTGSPVGSPISSGSHNNPVHGLTMDDWKFSKTHQFQTRSGFYRSISQYDSHIKEIRGEGGSEVKWWWWLRRRRIRAFWIGETKGRIEESIDGFSVCLSVSLGLSVQCNKVI